MNYQFLAYSTEDVAAQGKDFKLNEHRLFTLVPFLQSSERDASAYLNIRAQDVGTAAVLPDTRESFPDELWDIRLGGQYRQRFDNGWIGGVALGFGSASDKPFASWEEIFLDINLCARIPGRGRNAWLLFLNFQDPRVSPQPDVSRIRRLFRVAIKLGFLPESLWYEALESRPESYPPAPSIEEVLPRKRGELAKLHPTRPSAKEIQSATEPKEA